MIYISRICLILVLFSAVIFVPSRAWAVMMDPYSFTTIVGTVFFEYSRENRSEQASLVDHTTSRFGQNYGLTVRGKILSPKLIIYDTALNYNRSSNNTSFSKNINNSLSFNISTTLIPRSLIPLTLFGGRSTSWGSLNGESLDDSGITNTNMGLIWTGKFRVLPVMNFSMTRRVTESGGGDNKNKRLNLTYQADKEYGPTVNNFRYGIDFNDNTDGDSSTNSSISFSNRTKLSRHSDFDLAITRDSFDNNAVSDGKSKTLGLQMGLHSDPSRFFRQTHTLSHYRTDLEDSKSNGTTYSGHLDYEVSEKVRLNLTLGVSKQFTESDTSTNDTTDTTASSSFNYQLTKRLSISQSVSASFSETSSSDQSSLNFRDRKVFRSNTNLNYHREFSRANFNASYGLGYIWNTDINLEDSNEGGQGMTHNGAVGLSRIDFNRFFLFNTGASFSGVLKETSGQVKDERHRYFLNFDNRFWKKYLAMNGAYNKETRTDAIDEIRETEETTSFSVSSTPIKGGRVGVGLQRRVYFTDLSGRSTSNSADASAGYGHTLFGGSLSTTVSYSLSRDSFEGSSSRRNFARFNFTYDRQLIRRVLWNFTTDLTRALVDDTFSRSYVFRNTLFYRLRAWSLSMEHSYSISQTSTTDTRESRIFFKVGRQFVRMF